MTYVVKLLKAGSPSGAAYIGPDAHSGFCVAERYQAHRFDCQIEAERLADHFRGYWQGMGTFAPSDIVVEDVISEEEKLFAMRFAAEMREQLKAMPPVQIYYAVVADGGETFEALQ